MKTFVAAIIILSIILTGVVINSYSVHQMTDELLSSLSMIEHGKTDTLDSFISLWENYAAKLCFTVQKQKLDKVDEAIVILKSAIEEHDHYPLQRGVLLSRRALLDIAIDFSFRLDNIL